MCDFIDNCKNFTHSCIGQDPWNCYDPKDAKPANRPQAASEAGSECMNLLSGKVFEGYNDKLCHAISALAKHHTTQNPIPTDDYQKIHNLLMDIRLDIHNNKAT